MSQTLPPGPLSLRDALIAYGDPKAVQERRYLENHILPEELAQFADFRLSKPDEADFQTARTLEGERWLAQTRQCLIAPFLDKILAEQMFLRGVPAGLSPGSPNELIPNAWALELELTIGASTARRLTDRWVNVVATTIRPRADELATARALVDAARTATVGHVPHGAHVLQVARLTLSSPDLSKEFEIADVELRRFRQLAAGSAPAGFGGLVIGLDPIGRDLTEHQLINRLTRAAAALATDFVTRIHDGRVILTGLQVKPTLATARTALSPDWAPHMVFDWEGNAVRVSDAVFVDVQGEARRIAAPRKLPTIRAKVADGPGRPKFPFDAFVGIVLSSARLREHHNIREAAALLDEFRQCHPMRKAPSLTTIKSHVGKIYSAAGDAAATLKAPKPK